MKALFLILSLFSINAFAKIDLYQVKVASSVNGKMKSNAHLILRKNEILGFTDKSDNRIDVTISQDESGDDKNIELEIKVSRELEDGTVEAVTSPEILTLENMDAKFVFENTDGDTVSVITKVKIL